MIYSKEKAYRSYTIGINEVLPLDCLRAAVIELHTAEIVTTYFWKNDIALGNLLKSPKRLELHSSTSLDVKFKYRISYNEVKIMVDNLYKKLNRDIIGYVETTQAIGCGSIVEIFFIKTKHAFHDIYIDDEMLYVIRMNRCYAKNAQDIINRRWLRAYTSAFNKRRIELLDKKIEKKKEMGGC